MEICFFKRKIAWLKIDAIMETADAEWKASKPAYLVANSQSMQKTIEGVYLYWHFPQPKTLQPLK